MPFFRIRVSFPALRDVEHGDASLHSFSRSDTSAGGWALGSLVVASLEWRTLFDVARFGVSFCGGVCRKITGHSWAVEANVVATPGGGPSAGLRLLCITTSSCVSLRRCYCWASRRSRDRRRSIQRRHRFKLRFNCSSVASNCAHECRRISASTSLFPLRLPISVSQPSINQSPTPRANSQPRPRIPTRRTLPISNMHQILQYLVFHSAILPRPLQELNRVLDASGVKRIARVRMEGCAHGVPDLMAGGGGVQDAPEGAAVEGAVRAGELLVAVHLHGSERTLGG
jgi:hypothetical protein